MSLAFELQDDKDLREDQAIHPDGIVSFWQMLILNASAFISISAKLGGVYASLCAVTDMKLAHEIDTSEMIQTLGLVGLCEDLKLLDLPCTLASARRLLDRLKSSQFVSCESLQVHVQELAAGFREELKTHLFTVIPRRRVEYYKRTGTVLGDAIIQRFPQFSRDADEAGNCFAAGRYTACVFHLMRIMEVVVQQYATNVGATRADGSFLDVSKEDWYQIEKAIGREIETMSKGHKKDQYSALLGALSAVRAGWRNPTMHPSENYSEEEAETLIRVVKLFVEGFLSL